MIIGIDFDGTWSADPATFRAIVQVLNAAGHTCVIVTGRSDEGAWGAEVRMATKPLPVVFAGRNWKRDAALAAGFKIDVWIDDNPEYVGQQNLIGSAV